MKKLVIIFLLIPTFVFSQGWEKTYLDNGRGTSVKQTSDGGYIITGFTNNITTSTNDTYLIKTDGNGDTLWTKIYENNIGNDFGYSVQQTSDGGYFITGRSTNFTTFNDDTYLIKTDGNGDTLWIKKYTINNHELGLTSGQQTTDGGYIITGTTGSNISGFKVYLIKTNGYGDTIWTKTYGESHQSHGNSVQQTTDGGYIITGYTTYGACLIKTDGNGDTLWTKTYGEGCGFSVQQTSDGGYIITGLTRNITTSTDNTYLIKTDGNGDTLWTKTYGGIYGDWGYSVQQTTDGGYIITGYTTSVSNHKDIYLIKTDGNGNSSFIREIPIPNNNRKLIKRIDFLGREIIYPKKNIPYIEIYDDGIVKKKMILE